MYMILASSQNAEYLAIVWSQAIYGEEFFGMVANFHHWASRNSTSFLRCAGFSVLFGETFHKHVHIKQKKQAFTRPYGEKLVLPFVNKLVKSWSFSKLLSFPRFEKKFRSCKYPSSTLGHTNVR